MPFVNTAKKNCLLNSPNSLVYINDKISTITENMKN